QGIWTGVQPALSRTREEFGKLIDAGRELWAAIGSAVSPLLVALGVLDKKSGTSAESTARLASAGEWIGKTFGVVLDVVRGAAWALRTLSEWGKKAAEWMGKLWDKVKPMIQPLLTFADRLGLDEVAKGI